MTDRKTILLVDDTPSNLTIINAVLKDDYRTRIATGGAKALEIAAGAEGRPDLVLMDVMMPGMDGYEVCRRLKADPATADIPVIFLTALHDERDERAGFAAGGVDFITKPFSPEIVRARVRTHLALREANARLARQNAELERRVDERTRELALVRDLTIFSLASLAETRDNETGNHIRRTQTYVRELALALRDHPRFRAELDDATIDLLYKSAPLHDIGKVGVPDAILLKPGRLTPEEFEVMKQHAEFGRAAIAAAEARIGSGNGNSFLRYAREIAHTHHEKWDGSGYPRGLAGDAIPLSGRLMAVADVYDALICKRIYKPAYSHETAVDIITQGRGTHFDPDIVDAFLTLADRFRDIAAEFADPEEGEGEADPGAG
ncbi:two-component system response regulator (plasmid) [Tistrella mobilis]|uniref:response regulator n=1 Tax=Tistrella mobilis TaxID=171437 RepID=UPI0035591623